MGLAEVDVERGVKLLDLWIAGLVGVLEGKQVPVQDLLGIGLGAGEVMGGDAEFKIGLGGVPGLLLEAGSLGGAFFKFGL